MIDTDKYEGHTPAPWTNEYDEELGEHTIESGDGMVAQRVLGVDAQLIADAPLLLAEFTRTKEELQNEIKYLNYMLDGVDKWTLEHVSEQAQIKMHNEGECYQHFCTVCEKQEASE